MRSVPKVRRARASIAVQLVALLFVRQSYAHSSTPASESWIRTWGVPMQAPDALDYFPDGAKTFHDVTLRQIIRSTLGGDHLRIWVSNEFGNRPLEIGIAGVAHSATEGANSSGTSTILTFSGRRSIVVPVGTRVVSDPVQFSVEPLSKVMISFYLPHSTVGAIATTHPDGRQTGYISSIGDYTASDIFPAADIVHSYFFLTGVDVASSSPAATIIALGDSITDSTGSTPDTNGRWPDRLANRLNGNANNRLSVLNMGLSGNRLLRDFLGPSALSRFDRDVTAIPNVRYLIVLEGINDIAIPTWTGRADEDVTADDLIGALQQIIFRAHQHGIRVLVATLTPSGGCKYPGYDTPVGEQKRLAVNHWIREEILADAVLDFDKVLRDPDYPERLLPKYDSGDHLHPNDSGYTAMAASIDLSVFARLRGLSK
jgi:lysophospholipase L1-like esterase